MTAKVIRAFIPFDEYMAKIKERLKKDGVDWESLILEFDEPAKKVDDEPAQT